MYLKRGWLKTTVLLAIALFIHLFSRDPQRVESYYSSTFYQDLSSFQRTLFGWLPFSVGDVLYIIVILYIIVRILKRTGVLRKKYREIRFHDFLRKISTYINTLLILYILFNLVWGLNYNRASVAQKIGLKLHAYTKIELEEVTCLLIDKVNFFHSQLPGKYPSTRQLYKKVHNAYDKASGRFQFMRLNNLSAKTSLFSVIGSYAGFTGYYNPFTGEAQVCVDYPQFLLPYTACHEVAHQLGFAKENEANFVGYLAAANSGDPLLQYSVYLDLFIYANKSMYRSDSSIARAHRMSLNEGVQGHLEEWSEFNARHSNPVEPYFRWLYGKFLERNQQPRGMLTYDEVTGFIMALYKRDGNL